MQDGLVVGVRYGLVMLAVPPDAGGTLCALVGRATIMAFPMFDKDGSYITE